MDQDKELHRSNDAGAHWTLVASTAPTITPNVGQLPSRGLIDSLTVVTPDRLWLDLDFTNLTSSTDAGRTWFTTPVGGAPNGIDVFFSTPRTAGLPLTVHCLEPPTVCIGSR